MKAVAYCRVSSDDSDQLNSLQNQIDYFDQQFKENKYEKASTGILCKREGNVHLEGIYADEGITGTSLKKREAFKQMIRDAKKGMFNMIVTKSVARFGRSVEDLTKTLKDLKEIGVGVFFLDIQANSLENNREFMINLFASLAQEESNNKSFIIQFGLLKAKQNGKWTTQTPYGYQREDGMLKICPQESEVVKSMFKLFYEDMYGFKRITDYLNDANISTKKGGKWHPRTISRMLSNPIYTGKQIQHTIRNIDINRYISEEVPQEEWIVHNFEHLRIIDNHTFDLVQKEKEKRAIEFGDTVIHNAKQLDVDGEMVEVKVRNLKRGERRHSSTHLFSNLVYCGNCGSPLRRRKRQVRSQELYEWICARHDTRGNRECPYRNSFPEEELSGIIKQRIENYRKDDEQAKYNLQANLSVIHDFNKMSPLEEIDHAIKKLEMDRESNFELFSAKIIEMDEYKNRNDKIRNQLDELNKKKTLYNHIGKEEEYIKLKFEKDLMELRGIDLDHLTNSTLRKVVEKIKVYTRGSMKEVTVDFLINGSSMDDLMISLGKLKSE